MQCLRTVAHLFEMFVRCTFQFVSRATSLKPISKRKANRHSTSLGKAHPHYVGDASTNNLGDGHDGGLEMAHHFDGDSGSSKPQPAPHPPEGFGVLSKNETKNMTKLLVVTMCL